MCFVAVHVTADTAVQSRRSSAGSKSEREREAEEGAGWDAGAGCMRARRVHRQARGRGRAVGWLGLGALGPVDIVRLR